MRSTQLSAPSGRPLDLVDLSIRSSSPQLNLFGNECEGVCGVCSAPHMSTIDIRRATRCHSLTHAGGRYEDDARG
jgi:hypothetical protein